MKQISNKIIYITGGSSGIGRTTAGLLSSLGAHIIIFARDKSKLMEACDEIKNRKRFGHQKTGYMQMDVADNNDVTKKIGQAVKEFGTPDILINSAGIGKADYFENISYDAFDTVMKINLYGTRNVIAAVLPFMKEKGGHIINISSAAGLLPLFGYTAYGTSKYALNGFTECLRGELKRYNISISLLCPPEVDTPFVKEEALTIPPESRTIKNLVGTIRPEKVARAIVTIIRRKKFFNILGFMTRNLYLSHRLSCGWLSRITSDIIVSSMQKKSHHSGKAKNK